MKTALRSLLCLLFCTAAGAALPAAPLPEGPTAGKFLVLRNGRTMEGDIQLVDGQYRIRRNGGETLLPANLVLRLFLDTEHAYQFLRSKANLKDPDERLRLARWCLEYNLRAQAEEEASVALVLRPNDKETTELLGRIRQTPAPDAPMHQAPAPAPVAQDTSARQIELTPQSMGQFTHKVQPILINACASCHAAGHGTAFKLVRLTNSPSLNHRVTQENLLAVLGQVNFVQPQASPLLTKAVSIHGGDQAPIKGRESVPYQTLEEWLRLTLATNPQLQEHVGLAAVPPPLPSMAPKPEVKSAFAETNKIEAPQVVEAPRPIVAPATPPAKPADSGEGVCDPSEFNRQTHPERDPAPKP